MRRPFLLLVVIMSAVALFAQSGPAPITDSAVWQPGADFLTKARAACGQISAPQKFANCVIGQMPSAGAPPDAVTFTRELFKETGGEFGIMTGFHKVGPVDVAWIQYPLRSTYGLLLVNGKPRILNVEDLKQLDQKDMQQSFQFQDVLNSFPKAQLYPGDRKGKAWPNSQTGSNGGLQFIVGYPLRNGCDTCAHAGDVLFTWNFNATGRFTGTNFLGMTPAPLGHPSAGPAQQPPQQ